MLKRTPLYNVHLESGAKLTGFAGYEMPVSYRGVIAEHKAVRSRCGLFDVSHMGEVEVFGTEALDAVGYVTVNDATRLVDGKSQYTLICNERGGVIDDTLLYRFSADRFLFCVNASNKDSVLDWLKGKLASYTSRGGVELRDLSDETALLALQGPRAVEVLGRVTSAGLAAVRPFSFIEADCAGVEAIFSRTGYTGEDGFEIYVKATDAEGLWREIAEAGSESGLEPCGLGARDTLRLEASLPLYGHELGEEITPIEAGLKKFVSFDKGEFIGKEALREANEKGTKRILLGLEMKEAGIPRTGYKVYSKEGQELGVITSGTYSPSLKKAIALAYVESKTAGEADEFFVEIRGTRRKALKARLPFYSRRRLDKNASDCKTAAV